MNELALFAGVGGGILGGQLLGWNTVCAVEIDEYNRRVLLERQRDGCLDRFPIWDDVCTFDGKPWRGKIGVITGGFPCQNISFAGKREGIGGEKSGLWKEYRRIIEEVQPRYVFAENSGRLVTAGLEVVLQDLAEMGFDAAWAVIPASAIGAPHKRERTYIVAYPRQPWTEGNWGSSWIEGWFGRIQKTGEPCWSNGSVRDELWPTEPCLDRVLPNGVANALDRHYAIGNGQLPRVVRLAWNILQSTEVTL